ncbi:hypothetical protein [Streptomyces sp. yr375]|uniref:hypothetical protein n=1 Tax=Streptomyces sp. yr375 TaxID=1761906 RepID=UPI002108A71C|nr:hypothetical protein [Streptomyces sp. yr375]
MAFAAVLLAGGSVACGGGGKSDSAVADPSEVTSEVTSGATSKATSDVTSAAAVAAVAKAAQNSAGITSLRYRISGTVPTQGRVEAEASMSTKPQAMAIKMTAVGARRGDGLLEIRFVDEVMYVSGSAVHYEKLDGGKSWLSAAPAVWGRSAVDNQSYGVLPSPLEGSPATQSTLLNGSKDLRLIGTESVDGARTTHYEGTVDSAGLVPERLDQFIQLQVSDPLTMDLWVDGDNRTKQYRLRAEHTDAPTGIGAGASTAAGPLDLTITFLDVNRPVAVKAPPAKDTVPLADDAPKA